MCKEIKEYSFKCDSATVLIQSEDEDNAWEMLEELVDSSRYDEFELAGVNFLAPTPSDIKKD